MKTGTVQRTEAGPAAQRYDALIIGGGHNGLVCSAYLAAAGLKVLVLERRAVVGGAAVTEEFHPGFRNSVAAYTVSLLNPKVIRDLELPRYGLRVVERRCANFLPTEDGRYLMTGDGRTQGEVARFSARDAARIPEYGERRRAAGPGVGDAAECRRGRLAHGAAGAGARRPGRRPAHAA
jgi:phytoene dehydrogenase-like protein